MFVFSFYILLNSYSHIKMVPQKVLSGRLGLNLIATRKMSVFEPPRGKTNNLHRRKQKRRSASR